MQSLQLASTAFAQGGRLMGDAVGDIFNRGLSFDPAVVTEPGYLSRMINDYAAATLTGPADITAVELLDIPSVSSNCNNLVVSIEQAGTSPPLPTTLFLKLPSPSLATRWFLNVIESWKLECDFFRQVAPTLPIRTPTTFAAGYQGTRFCLVQEDLNADPGVRLFTNFDMRQGPSLQQAAMCLDTFARMHAAHYGLADSERLALLSLDRHPFLGRNMRTLAPTLNRVSLGPCRKRVPGVIDDRLAALFNRTLDNWEQLLRHWYRGPLSLCHGDSHLGNFFISGDEMGMLDFQAPHWGPGIRDVQYFLIDSLPAQVLASHERDLVRYYVERRAAHGTAIDCEETWEEYRGFSFHTWMTIVVAIGLAAMSEEQDELMVEILRRTVAAIERLDYAGWLESVLAR
jgi:hypothetical protein